MGNACRSAKSSTTLLNLAEFEELTSSQTSTLEPRIDQDNNGNSDHDGHLRHLTNDRSDLPSDSEGQDASGHALEVTTKNPDHHVPLWTVGFLLFTVFDCVLLGLLVKVSLELADLAALPTPSGNATARSSEVLLEDSAFCLPCSEVYLNEIEMLQNRFRVRQRRASGGGRRVWNESLCCAEPHDDLKTLVGEMFIRVHYGRDRASGEVKINVNETEDDSRGEVIAPHLQLQLDKDAEPQEVNGTHTLPLMLSKRDVSRRAGKETTTSSSASVREGVITISHPGHFYIYSYVPFSFNLRPTTLTQYVYRVRNGGETLLLENSVFPCDVSLRSCEQSFVGGVFLFESGDEVVLRVSDHSHVRRKEEVELGVHRL